MPTSGPPYAGVPAGASHCAPPSRWIDTPGVAASHATLSITVPPAPSWIAPCALSSANPNVPSTSGSPPLRAGSELRANSARSPAARCAQLGPSTTGVEPSATPPSCTPFRSTSASATSSIHSPSPSATAVGSAIHSPIASWPAAGVSIARITPASSHAPGGGAATHAGLASPGVPKFIGSNSVAAAGSAAHQRSGSALAAAAGADPPSSWSDRPAVDAPNVT